MKYLQTLFCIFSAAWLLNLSNVTWAEDKLAEPCPPQDCVGFDISKKIGGQNLDRVSVAAAFGNSEHAIWFTQIDMKAGDFPVEFLTNFWWLSSGTLYPIQMGMYTGKAYTGGLSNFQGDLKSHDKGQVVGHVNWKEGEAGASLECNGNKSTLGAMPPESLPELTRKIREKSVQAYQNPPQTIPVGLYRVGSTDQYIYVESNYRRSDRADFLMGPRGALVSQELERVMSYLDGGTRIYDVKGKGRLVIPPQRPDFAQGKKPSWTPTNGQTVAAVLIGSKAEELAEFGIKLPVNEKPVVKGPCD